MMQLRDREREEIIDNGTVVFSHSLHVIVDIITVLASNMLIIMIVGRWEDIYLIHIQFSSLPSIHFT